jgi:hypothetical protein
LRSRYLGADVSTLDRSVIGDIEKVALGDEGATLYLGKR